MGASALANDGTVVGVLALVILQLVKLLRTEKHRRDDMNGGNPVVSAIQTLSAAIKEDNRDSEARVLKRLEQQEVKTDKHQEREERTLERIDGHLEVIRERLAPR